MERSPRPSVAGSRRRAGDLLRRHYVALVPSLRLREAESLLLATRARCLPVVEGERLAGVLTHRALHERYADALRPLRDASPAALRERLEAARAEPVRAAMALPAATATPATPLPEVARLLERMGTGCVAVLEAAREGSAILGIVTESDLLRAARDPRFRLHAPLSAGP